MPYTSPYASLIEGIGVTVATTITVLGTGTGGAGTYTVICLSDASEILKTSIRYPQKILPSGNSNASPHKSLLHHNHPMKDFIIILADQNIKK